MPHNWYKLAQDFETITDDYFGYYNRVNMAPEIIGDLDETGVLGPFSVIDVFPPKIIELIENHINKHYADALDVNEFLTDPIVYLYYSMKQISPSISEAKGGGVPFHSGGNIYFPIGIVSREGQTLDYYTLNWKIWFHELLHFIDYETEKSYGFYDILEHRIVKPIAKFLNWYALGKWWRKHNPNPAEINADINSVKAYFDWLQMHNIPLPSAQKVEDRLLELFQGKTDDQRFRAWKKTIRPLYDKVKQEYEESHGGID